MQALFDTIMQNASAHAESQRVQQRADDRSLTGAPWLYLSALQAESLTGYIGGLQCCAPCCDFADSSTSIESGASLLCLRPPQLRMCSGSSK
jgi:hypothetical protein